MDQLAVRAFFIQVLGVVAVTSFATIPDETIAERVGHCRFLVDLKTEELVVSLRDPTRSVDVTFRYVTTVGCDAKVSAGDSPAWCRPSRCATLLA